MVICRVLFLFLILSSALFSEESSEIIHTEPQEVVSLLASKFSSFTTYTSSFKEWTLGGLRRGVIKYSKPHNLSVVYQLKNNEDDMLVVANEKKLYVYLPRVNIVCEQDLKENVVVSDVDKNEESLVEAMSLVNLERLVKSYSFNFVESKKPVDILKDSEQQKFSMNLKSDLKAYRFKLTPKDITLGLSDMEVWIGTNGLIYRSRSTTLEGREIDFVFYAIKLNEFIPKKDFEFEIPADAQILKNTLMPFEDVNVETKVGEGKG